MRPRIQLRSPENWGRNARRRSRRVIRDCEPPAGKRAKRNLQLLVGLEIVGRHGVGTRRAVATLRGVVVVDLREVQVEGVDGQSIFVPFLASAGLVSGNQDLLQLDLHVLDLGATSSPASQRNFRKMLASRARQHELRGRRVHALRELKFMKLRFTDTRAGADRGRAAGLPNSKLEADQVNLTLVLVVQRFSLDVSEFQKKVGMARHWC